jgi:branched-chain amino acid transport system substrate-binding protein
VPLVAAHGSHPAHPAVPAAPASGATTAARLDRRRFLQVAGVAGAAAGISSLTSGCAAKTTVSGARPVRIGMVSNQTGSLAGFGEADSVVIANVRTALKDTIKINGTTYPLEILLRDTGSQSPRAAQVANDLIHGAKVDLLLAAGAPEIVNPVANVAERAETPCLSTNVPWQAYFFGRQADALAKGEAPRSFNWTYHFFWGLEDVIAVFNGIWSQVPNNKVIGPVFTNDADGNAWADPKTGLPAAFQPRGYTFIDVPQPDVGANSYTKLIDKFKAGDAQILTGLLPATDFATLWRQTNERGFRPPLVTIGKALLFPAFMEVLQPNPAGLTGTISWHPTWPTSSPLLGKSSAEWAAAYTAQTHRQWTQPIGTVLSLFEVAISVLQRAGVGDPQAIVDAIRDTSMDTTLGHVSWKQGHDPKLPPPAQKNVAKTPLVGGQWINATSGGFPFDQVVTTNPGHPNIPVARTVQRLPAQAS